MTSAAASGGGRLRDRSERERDRGRRFEEGESSTCGEDGLRGERGVTGDAGRDQEMGERGPTYSIRREKGRTGRGCEGAEGLSESGKSRGGRSEFIRASVSVLFPPCECVAVCYRSMAKRVRV